MGRRGPFRAARRDLAAASSQFVADWACRYGDGSMLAVRRHGVDTMLIALVPAGDPRTVKFQSAPLSPDDARQLADQLIAFANDAQRKS